MAEAADCGGAHGKIAYLYDKFDVRVLMEVHDLLVQPTRVGHVHTVLKLLEKQFSRGVDGDAMSQICCADGPRPAHLTEQGTILYQILMWAPAEVRAAGYTAYAEERAASAGDRPSLLGFHEMQERRAGSSSSSNAPASEASSPGSVTSKRHSRPSEAAQASEGAREGACVAGSSDS